MREFVVDSFKNIEFIRLKPHFVLVPQTSLLVNFVAMSRNAQFLAFPGAESPANIEVFVRGYASDSLRRVGAPAAFLSVTPLVLHRQHWIKAMLTELRRLSRRFDKKAANPDFSVKGDFANETVLINSIFL